MMGAQDHWQPIETAPKDGGTEILVWGPGQYRKVVYWDDDNGNSAAFPWVDPQGDSYQATAFTCWQPLPPPPNVAKAAPSREDKARALVRDIIVNVFKQKADDSMISNVVAKVLKTFPKTDTEAHGGEMRQYTESSSTKAARPTICPDTKDLCKGFRYCDDKHCYLRDAREGVGRHESSPTQTVAAPEPTEVDVEGRP